MTYKKFIKKDGKIYGPYIYHSRRENGEVVTEYLGKNKNKKNLFLIIATVVILLSLSLFFYRFFIGGVFVPTGRAILELHTDYKPNETLNGAMKLSLNKGEFVPADSQVVINLAGEVHTYQLRDVITQKPNQGSFYVENLNLNGQGEGFGEAGAKESYPDVNFELDVFSSDTEIQPVSNENKTTEEKSNSENVTETPSESNTSSSGSVSNQTISGGESTAVTTSPTENTGETPVTNEGAPATGNFVKTISGLVVSSDVVDTIQGAVSFGNPYEFTLDSGTSASVKSGSVEVNGKKIDDSYVSIAIKDGQAVVTTTYKEEEKGFGKDYVKNEKVSLDLDLSSLNLIAKDGTMKITLMYGDNNIAETSTNINVVGISETNKTSTENESKITNETVVEVNETNIEGINLTVKEKEVLIKNAGTDTLKTTSAQVKNDRLLIKYELGKYWVEYTYTYSGTNNSISADLENKIEIERKKWLKNLALQLSKEKSNNSSSVSDLLKDYNLKESEVINQTLINETESNQTIANLTV